jgi:hypothetical protein
MGTRCLTVFVDGETEIAVLYRQMDGYPSGHGKDLTDLLAGARVTNGISMKETGLAFNGMGDCAVRVISELKNQSGGFNSPGQYYLYPPKTRDVGEDYVYYVGEMDGRVVLTAFSVSGGYEGKSREEVELDAEESASMRGE